MEFVESFGIFWGPNRRLEYAGTAAMVELRGTLLLGATVFNNGIGGEKNDVED